MQVLEPVLIKTDQVVAGSGATSQEVDFSFAALEGALILQTQFFLYTDNVVADMEADNVVCAALNYNPSIDFTTIQGILDDDFTFSAFTTAVINVTAASVFNAITNSPLYTHDGLLIVRNNSVHGFATAGSPTFTVKQWYKRVIFDERELVPFVALRR